MALALSRLSVACAPNNCADEMLTCPSAKAIKSTRAVRRATRSISLCRWSRMTASSMMIRLKNPRSTRPTLTCVPSILLIASDAFSPSQVCTKGIWTSPINVIQRPQIVQSVQLKICLSCFNSVSSRLQMPVASALFLRKITIKSSDLRIFGQEI